MERKQILLVGLGREDILVRKALEGEDIAVLSADRSLLKKTVGEVFSQELTGDSEEAFRPAFLMFRNFSREDLDPAIHLLRQAGLSHQPLKAMVTPTNWRWTLGDLYAELQQEQQVMGALIRLRKLRDSMPLPDFMDIPAMKARMQAEALLKGGEEATVEAIEGAYQELLKYKK